MDERLPRKLAAILYADVAGYSRLTGLDEEGTHQFEAMVAESQPPDLVIVDMLIPEKGGYLLIGEIKEASPDAKIIAVVEDVSAQQLILEISGFLGADRTLPRPISSVDLLESVGGCLA